MRNNWRWCALAAGTAAVLALGACSDDDDGADGSAAVTEADAPAEADQAAADPAEFCDAIEDLGLALAIGEGFEGMDDALAEAEEIAPEEISAAVTTMVDENRAAVEAGPPAPDDPPNIPSDEFFEASTEVGDYMADNCDYQVIDVTTTEYEFEGLPSELEGGKTLIRMTNDGSEFHEVLVQQIADDATQSVEELVAMPEAESGEILTYAGSAFAPPGLGNWAVVDLSEGRFAATCYVSEGATSPEGLYDEQSKRHLDHGMVAEIEVS